MIALLVAPAPSAAPPAATLTMIPEVKGLPAPHPYAISPDGAVVVGGFSPANGFRYDVASRRLGRISPGGRAVYPNGVANGGRIVAGVAKNAFVLSGGTFRELSPLRGDTASVASAVSADGSAVVGYSQSEEGTFRAVRWKGRGVGVLARPDGITDMHARGVGRSGLVIVGAAYDEKKAVRAFLWTEMLATRLLPIPTWAKESSAEAITPDGRYAAGSVSSRRRTSAARWVLGFGKVATLAGLPNAPTGAALAIDPAGRFVAGFSGDKAVVWDAKGFVRPAQSFLVARGAEVAGWSFEQIVGIGRRGKRVVLTGWGAKNGKSAGFVAAFTE